MGCSQRSTSGPFPIQLKMLALNHHSKMGHSLTLWKWKYSLIFYIFSSVSLFLPKSFFLILKTHWFSDFLIWRNKQPLCTKIVSPAQSEDSQESSAASCVTCLRQTLIFWLLHQNHMNICTDSAQVVTGILHIHMGYLIYSTYIQGATLDVYCLFYWSRSTSATISLCQK